MKLRQVVFAAPLCLALPIQALAVDPGERAFRKCFACHSVDAADADRPLTGPFLRGVVGRPAAALPGFDYSPAMRAAAADGLVWTGEALDAFITDPPAFIPGTSMGLVRMSDPAERAVVIDYLKRQAP
jgi:cytochrome c